MLEVKNITKIYKVKKKEIVALDNISISFPDKGLISFMGESGCGKSTLMNMLSGLDTLTSGQIFYNGKSFKSFRKRDFDHYRRNEIGMVFQEDNLLYDLTVYENVILPLKLMNLPVLENEIDDILNQMSITDLKDRQINELSGGQKQRVAIARTLAKKPKVILADEPTGSLDEDNAKKIFEILKEISKDRLVIVFTHDRVLATDFSNLLYKMNLGKIEKVTNIDSIQKEEFASRELNKHRGYPFLYLFKMGMANLKIKIARLILIIILSSFAFSLFGVCLSTLNYNEADMFAKSAEKYNYSGILKVTRWEKTDYWSTRTALDTEFIDSFNHDMKENIKMIYFMTNRNEELSNSHNFSDEAKYQEILEKVIFSSQSNLYSVYRLSVHTFTVFSEDDIATSGYSLVGRLPVNDFEIAISDYQFYSYLKMGYRKGDLEIESQDITKEIMLGKVIDYQGYEFTITGIYESGFNKDAFEALFNEENETEKKKFCKEVDFLFADQLVSENTLHILQQEKEMISYSGKLILPKNRQKVADIYTYIQNSGTSDVVKYEMSYYNLDIVTSVTAVLLTVKYLTGIAAIVLGIFSVLLLLSYVNISIQNRMYDIGIIRSLGANAWDTGTIFSSEVFVISMLNFVLSLISTAIIVAIINSKFIAMYQLVVAPYDFSFTLVLCLLALCLFSGFLSLIIPIFKLTRKKIINLIK